MSARQTAERRSPHREVDADEEKRVQRAASDVRDGGLSASAAEKARRVSLKKVQAAVDAARKKPVTLRRRCMKCGEPFEGPVDPTLSHCARCCDECKEKGAT